MATPAGAEVAEDHAVTMKTHPLNSKRLTADTLGRIARAPGLPASGSVAETRQLIEGKLGESYEPMNVQVDLIEAAPGTLASRLRSADGVIVEIPPEDKADSEDQNATRKGLAKRRRLTTRKTAARRGGARTSREEELAARVPDVEAELESLRVRARELETDLERALESRQHLEDQFTTKVSRLKERVKGEKEKYHTLWRLNCTQLIEYDEALAKKDEENQLLQEQVHALEDAARVMASRGSTSRGSAASCTSRFDRIAPPPTEHEGGSESGEAVVPVPNPGRGPTHFPDGKGKGTCPTPREKLVLSPGAWGFALGHQRCQLTPHRAKWACGMKNEGGCPQFPLHYTGNLPPTSHQGLPLGETRTPFWLQKNLYVTVMPHPCHHHDRVMESAAL